MRRRQLERPNPRPLTPPNKTRQSASNPKACQKVTCRQPNSGGSSQFHRCIISSPPIRMKSAIAIGARKIIASHFLRMWCSLFLCKFVVDVLQSFAQVQHRVSLAREQRVYAHAGFRRELFEAAPVDFVRDEYLALLDG